MNISRAIAIAIVGLSMGLSASSANAGFLADAVSKVGKKVAQSASPKKKSNDQFSKYLKCWDYNSRGKPSSLSRDATGRVEKLCQEYARS